MTWLQLSPREVEVRKYFSCLEQLDQLINKFVVIQIDIGELELHQLDTIDKAGIQKLPMLSQATINVVQLYLS